MIDHSLLPDLQNFSALVNADTPGRIWVTRGAVRCSILKDLKLFDDLDIIVNEPVSWVVQKFKPVAIRQTRYGGFTMRLPSGRLADVWSLQNTMGRSCSDISEALDLFEFSCDAMAVDIVDGSFVGDKSSKLTREGYFDVQTGFTFLDTSKKFLAMKGLYISIRHKLRPGPIILDLISDITVNADELIYIRYRLREELLSVCNADEIDARLALISGVRFHDIFSGK